MKRFQFIALLFAPLIWIWKPRKIKFIAAKLRQNGETKTSVSYQVVGFTVYYYDGGDEFFETSEALSCTRSWKEYASRNADPAWWTKHESGNVDRA